MKLKNYQIYIFIFLLSILVTSLFLLVLPENWKVNESSDYVAHYEPLARNLLSGNGYTKDGSDLETFYPPGFPLILAGLFGLANILNISEYFIISGANVILTALSVVFLYFIANKYTNQKSAFIASLLWMTYPFLLWLTKQPNSEIPFIFFLFAACNFFFGVSTFKKNKWIPLLTSGILLGGAILLRPIAVFFPIAMVATLFYIENQYSIKKRILLSGIFLIGVIGLILPWEIAVFLNTGKVVLISENSSTSIRGGLVFAIRENTYKQEVTIPSDVKNLMEEILINYDNFLDKGEITSFFIGKLIENPIPVIKLFGIKALRSWYATDRQSYELYIILLQIPYIFMILMGSFLTWNNDKKSKKLLVGVWSITFINWFIVIMVTSTLRYMVPVIGLLFILITFIPYHFLNKFQLLRIKKEIAE